MTWNVIRLIPHEPLLTQLRHIKLQFNLHAATFNHVVIQWIQFSRKFVDANVIGGFEIAEHFMKLRAVAKAMKL